MKIFNWKDFDVWVHCMVHRCNQLKGGRDTGVGGINQVNHIVGILFRTPWARERFSIASVSCISW